MLLYHPDFPRNRDILQNYLDAKITSSLEEFTHYMGEKFYLITIFDIWAGNNADTKKEDICWEDVLTEEFVTELKTHQHPIIFDASSECTIKATFDSLINLCEYVKIKPQDVYICVTNAQSVELNLQAYPYLESYNLFSIERFEYDAAQIGYSIGSIIYNFKFNERKRFLFINRRYSVDRAYLYFKFRQKNLLDKMHCTFRLDNIYDNRPVTLDTVTNNINTTFKDPLIIDYIQSNAESINNSLPNEIRTETIDLYKSDYKVSCLYTFWNLAAHNSTDINIITETFRNHYGIPANDIHYKKFFFITEKTYRTILMKQPFILFSNPYALKYLRNAGYKTFSPFINESYDNIENLFGRQNMIVNEVNRLSNMPTDEFNELLVNCKEIAKHNYEVLMNRIHDKYYHTAWTSDKLKPYVRSINFDILGTTLIKWHNNIY